MVEQASAAGSVESAKALVTAMRSLLRFLHVDGRITVPLVGAVPAVAGWRLGSLPRGLPRAQVDALLAAHDTTTPVGLRDHAVVSVLERLGLRGAEVAALRLNDVDWHRGEILVRGKGSRMHGRHRRRLHGRAVDTQQQHQQPVDHHRGLSCLTVGANPTHARKVAPTAACARRNCDQDGPPRRGAGPSCDTSS
jgi:site-specific recombinase XerC